MFQQYTSLSSPKDQGPAGPRVVSDLCLQTQFCKIIVSLLLVSAPWWVRLVQRFVQASWWGCAGACPLVGRTGSWPSGEQGPCQGTCLEVAVGSLSADGWGCIPALSVVWPEAGAYRLLGGARSQYLGFKVSASSQSSCRSPLCPPPAFMTPERATATPASPGDPPRPSGRSGPDSYGVTAFALEPSVHKTLCALSKSGVCFSQSHGAPAVKPCWSSKPNALESLPPDAGHLGWGDWRGTQRSRTPAMYLFSSLWDAHASGMGFDNLLSALLLSRGFFFMSLDVEYLFFFFWQIPVFFLNFLFYIGVQLINNVVLASGAQQNDSLIHIHLSILSQILFPSRSLHNIEQSSLCYTVGPCSFFILNIAVCTCQFQTP